MTRLESIRAKAALKAAKTQEALLAVLRDAGFDVTADELAAMQQSGAAISDEAMEGVAGGKTIIIPMNEQAMRYAGIFKEPPGFPMEPGGFVMRIVDRIRTPPGTAPWESR